MLHPIPLCFSVCKKIAEQRPKWKSEAAVMITSSRCKAALVKRSRQSCIDEGTRQSCIDEESRQSNGGNLLIRKGEKNPKYLYVVDLQPWQQKEVTPFLISLEKSLIIIRRVSLKNCKSSRILILMWTQICRFALFILCD